MKRFCLLFLTLALGVSCSAKEVQNHGVIFEKWIRDTFFDGYEPASYTQKWDIPAEANKRYGGIPVNPKATKFKTPVDMGDALRQFDVGEPFWLIIGYWEQFGDKKRFVNVVAAQTDKAKYHELWGEVTRADLEKLDGVIKNTPNIVEARKLAQALKREKPFSTAIFTLNPKIDAHQRRLQCSLSFAKVFKFLAPKNDPALQEKPLLWGVPVDMEIESPPRGSKDKDEKAADGDGTQAETNDEK